MDYGLKNTIFSLQNNTDEGFVWKCVWAYIWTENKVTFGAARRDVWNGVVFSISFKHFEPNPFQNLIFKNHDKQFKTDSRA